MKVRLDRLVMAGGVVILVLAGLLTWQLLHDEAEPEVAPLDERLDSLRDKPRAARAQPRERWPATRPDDPVRASEIGEGVAVPKPELGSDPGELGPEEAVDTFKIVLGELEAAAASGQALTRREQWELYNRATGSFTALSAWVDVSDPKERALMEDAYRQMTSLMAELELERPPQMLGKHDYDPRHPERGWH